MEKVWDIGYGFIYLLMYEEKCLGMGIINYIYYMYFIVNFGYWFRLDVCGKGLVIVICEVLKKFVFF